MYVLISNKYLGTNIQADYHQKLYICSWYYSTTNIFNQNLASYNASVLLVEAFYKARFILDIILL